MSRQRKTAAVLRPSRGEDLEAVSRSPGVTASTVSGRRDAFLCAGEAASTAMPATAEVPGPVRRGVRRRFGAIAGNVAEGLALRHDHGGRYVADVFQTEIAFLGIDSSPTFVRAPEGIGCAERFLRTLKENLLRVRTFDTVESRVGADGIVLGEGDDQATWTP